MLEVERRYSHLPGWLKRVVKGAAETAIVLNRSYHDGERDIDFHCDEAGCDELMRQDAMDMLHDIFAAEDYDISVM